VTESLRPTCQIWPRFGLCCKFLEQPIAFRTTTATFIGRQSRKGAIDKLSDIAVQNSVALRKARPQDHD